MSSNFFKLLLLIITLFNWGISFGQRGHNGDSVSRMPSNDYVTAIALIMVVIIIIGIFKYGLKKPNDKRDQ